MCGPAAVPIMMGLSMALTAAGAVQTVRANNAAADAAQEQAVENAKFADAQAKNATMTGLVEEDRRRAQTRAMLAKQRVALAANNVDMSTGTPLELLGDTAAVGEQDALMIRANAARDAWGYRSQGVNYLNEGAMAKASAKNQNTATILTSAGKLLDQGYGLAQSMPSGGTKGMTVGPVQKQKISTTGLWG